MKHRLRKYAKRLMILLVVLAVIGVGVFWWICYSPFEGKVDDMLALVPYTAEFVTRVDYDGLMETGWPESNLETHPIHPMISDWVKGSGAFRAKDMRDSTLPAIKQQLADLEAQINGNIPLSGVWGPFDIVGDVLSGETIVAGRWCAGIHPKQGPPSWQELLLLTRVSWRTQCIAALQHEFVRDQVNNSAPVIIEALDHGVLKLTFKTIRVSQVSARNGCGGGFIMPPENIWYLRRVKDVIALSNSKALISDVAELSKDNAPESFANRPGFEMQLNRNGFVAASDLNPLHGYLVKALESNPRAGILGRFLRPRSIEKLNGSLTFESADLIRAGADISYIRKEAGDVAEKVYALTPRPVSEGIASLVPAKDTFAVLFLRADPFFLLKSIYEDALTTRERMEWNKNLRGLKKYRTVDEFFRELAEYMGDTSTVAVARLSEIYDELEYSEWYSNDIAPGQGIAIMTRVRHGRTFDQVNEFLRDRVPFLGFAGELKSVEYRGYTYTHVDLPTRPMDIAHIDPAYVLVEDHLIFANNQIYLRQILDTIADGERNSMKDDPTFRATMASLPAEGHVGFFLDIEKLTRIPKDTSPGGLPRGFLWDDRNAQVTQAHDIEIETDRINKEIARMRPPPKNENEEFDLRMEAYMGTYPAWIEEYRRDLEGLRRFGGFGFVFNAAGETIDAQFAFTFREAEDWLRWKQD